MLPQGIIRIDREAPASESNIGQDVLLAGKSDTKLWNAFTDQTGQFSVGHWASGSCKLKVSYDENEFCLLLSGKAILTDESGQSCEFGPGEAFTIAAGFKGTWESVGDVVKIYAAFEAA
ncbi:cupin domain-containing protein [Kiloniella laminariae]|uniref:Cupin domain-containing protein n=1 Tax=Kiloniella laminariae TaxID=454162 RepID=A0ABT4LDI0_9PROT|nr:cupin domain-containing protein [Kiloniella laminariae]MCZ4279161.1 cupin domain-containing protein [Kiloniella laminariae]